LDVVTGGLDAVAGGFDVVSGGVDVVAGGFDVVSGGLDVVSGGSEVVGFSVVVGCASEVGVTVGPTDTETETVGDVGGLELKP
jgi:integrin beta 3